MNTVLTITRLTIRETQRRRILWVALLMGVAFLAVYGLGFHYIFVEVERSGYRAAALTATTVDFLRMAGLYAIYFLVIAMSALVSANTISGELESHTMESVVTKPIRRWQVVLGKWLGLAIIVAAYTLLLAGGVIAIVFMRSRLMVANAPAGLGLMVLGDLTMLSLTILGGTRLSTLANGALAFMLYGVAFIGGWVEQIGAVLRNETAVDLGIFSSLIMPADVLWKRAATLFQTPTALGDLNLAGPFVVASQPHDRVILYAIFYALGLLALAMWSFSRRDL